MHGSKNLYAFISPKEMCHATRMNELCRIPNACRYTYEYGVAMISRPLKIIGLLCRKSSLMYNDVYDDTHSDVGWLRSVGSIKL